MAPMAVPSDIPLGVPMSTHEYDLTDADSLNKKGFYSIGANPPPAWSQRESFLHSTFTNTTSTYSLHEIEMSSLIADVGPVHKAPPPVATQLVVPTELNDGPVDLTCFHCQHHVRTNTKSGPSFLAWALCCCLCVVGV